MPWSSWQQACLLKRPLPSQRASPLRSPVHPHRGHQAGAPAPVSRQEAMTCFSIAAVYLQQASVSGVCMFLGSFNQVAYSHVLLTPMQKDKDGEGEALAEESREAPKEPSDPASAHAQAAAAAAARRLNSSAAAAEHVRIAAIKRAAEFVKVMISPSGTHLGTKSLLRGYTAVQIQLQLCRLPIICSTCL